MLPSGGYSIYSSYSIHDTSLFSSIFLLNCLFCSIIVNKFNYLNKITSEVVKLTIAITHSNISRALVYHKSKEYSLFYISAELSSFGRMWPKISLTAPTNRPTRFVTYFTSIEISLNLVDIQ